MTCVFGIVGDEVLHGCADALFLYTADVSHGNAGAEPGILTEILEVAPVRGRTIDVDTRSQEIARSSGPRIAPELTPYFLRKFRIPARSQADSGRECRRGTRRTHAARTIAHVKRRNFEPRH